MKNIVIVSIFLLLISFTVKAQGDYMYPMKSGTAKARYSVNSQIDSIVFYRPEINTASSIAKVSIPGGTIKLGSSMNEAERQQDEYLHEVILSPFRMSQCEITNSQFAYFLNQRSIGSDCLYPSGLYPTQPLLYAGSTTDLNYNGIMWYVRVGKENKPVANVTWFGAAEFARFANGSLPTEAQWEFACRALSTTPYFWGECLTNNHASYNWLYSYGSCQNTSTVNQTPSNVNAFKTNGFGLYNMHGNVLEWCSDWYGAYPTSTQTDPTGTSSGSKKVCRGGAYTSKAAQCRSAFRTSYAPNFYHSAIGFRVAFPAQDIINNYDTMYVMRAGDIVNKISMRPEDTDSIVFDYKGLGGLIYSNPSMSIFANALYMTHLSDSLLQIDDANYQATQSYKDEYNSYEIVTPKERKYGYTVFVESDEVFKSYGIDNLNDLIFKAKELYPCDPIYDTDFTNPKNSLNKFIAYHIVNKNINYNKFFYYRNSISNYTPDEFFETRLTDRIIKATRVGTDIVLNPNTDYSTIVKPTTNNAVFNGVFHCINKMLVYSAKTEIALQNSRIRYDFTSIFPELTNNNIRASEGFMTKNNTSGDRFGFQPGYLKDMSWSKDTRLIYLAGKQGQWADYQGDQFIALGVYDVTIRLLPIPPGTYEIRYAYSANANRGFTQIYVDNVSVGLPVDLRINSADPTIGYIADKLTDDNGYQNDKDMRNRGYMKAPNTYLYGSTIVRDVPNELRKIVGEFTFSDYKAHTIRFQSTLSDNNKQLILDYIEFVPKSIYDSADGMPESRD